MNITYSIVWALILTITPTCTMDTAIPLHQIGGPKKSLRQKLTRFEEKITAELNENNWFSKNEIVPHVYLARIEKHLPEVIASEKNIVKFSHIPNSYFANAMQSLITHEGKDHYTQVTSDTLATINQPEAHQPCAILNNLPLLLKKYVMQQSLDAITQPYSCIKFKSRPHAIDVHANVNLAAFADEDYNEFQVCDLLTHTTYLLPRKARNGLIRFSTNGSQIITAAVPSKHQKTTKIDIWNSTTRKCITTISHFCQVHNIFCQNKKILIFDTAGFLSIYKLNKDTTTYTIATPIQVGTAEMNPGFTCPGNYLLNDTILCKKSAAYFLCRQAIRNTNSIYSLPKIYTNQIYASLTEIEKEIIKKHITHKLHALLSQEEKRSTMSWFG